MNGVQTRFKCKLDVKRCKRFVFPPSSLLPRSNALKTKAIRYFQTDRTLTRIVSPPLNAFYPHQIKTNHVRPPVVITALEIFNKQIPVGNKLLPKSLNQLEELELSYKENAFSLLYASLSYCTPNKNKYAYKLEGFDKDWNYVGSQNKATYTNLPAGTYLSK